MSDKKITELPVLSVTPELTDLLLVVDVEAAENTTKQITWYNLGFYPRVGIFGGIHVHDNAVAQSVPTGAAYTKLTHFVDNDASNDMTPDADNDKITITTPGNYLLNCSMNFSDGTNNVTWYIAPFLDGVEWDAIHVVRKIGTAGDVGSASMSGIITVDTVPVDLDIRGRHNNGGSIDLTMVYSNLSLVYVGEI